MPKKRSGLKLIIGFVSFFLIIIGGLLYYKTALKKSPSKSAEVHQFIVEQGEGVAVIAQKLEDEGLINSSNLFKIYLRINNLAGDLQAGEYHIPKNLNLVQLVDMLQHGTFAKRVTVIEGLRREEIAEVFEEEMGFTQADFLVASEGLEGTLFPETYFFEKDTSVEDVVGKMTATYDHKVTDELISQAQATGLSEKQLLIFASIVEREVAKESDRAIVAGILIKRWQADWPLQADATVQYALGTADDWWPKVLDGNDLDNDSPYNTRKHPGLPPAPICNPSLSAISATAYPVSTTYWYYLTDDQGVTHYAETLDQHEENISEYLSL